jgi:hypothetical protein
MKVERMEEKQIKAFVGFIQNICPNAIFDYKKEYVQSKWRLV